MRKTAALSSTGNTVAITLITPARGFECNGMATRVTRESALHPVIWKLSLNSLSIHLNGPNAIRPARAV
jgi:hypothetical protein